MAKTYTLNVAGLTRELTICKVNDHMDIAAFIMLGDAELTVAAATELLKKCPEFDILLTAEAKGIPLAHEMSRQSGIPTSAHARAKSSIWPTLSWWRISPSPPQVSRSWSSTARSWTR